MNNLLSGDELKTDLTNYIYIPKQKHEFSFDLTVNEVFQPQPPASIDFGGSELQPATLKPLIIEKHSPDDKFGWWNLNHGPKLIKFNEKFSISSNCILVYPLERLLQVGGFLIPFKVESEEPLAFILVGMPSLRLKQNARIATAIGWKIK